MSFDLKLKGRRALVTGGSKGVGAAVVSALRDAGVRIVAAARSVPSDADNVHYVTADVTTAKGCERVARETLAHLGGIDILVNVLGGSTAPGGGFAVLSDDEWRRERRRRIWPSASPRRQVLTTRAASRSS